MAFYRPLGYELDNIDNVNLSSQDKFLLVHDQKHF